MDAAAVDDIIRRLLDARGGRTPRNAQVTDAEIRKLCATAKDVFLSQPNLLELEAPIKICGKNGGFPLASASACLFLSSSFSSISGLGAFLPSAVRLCSAASVLRGIGVDSLNLIFCGTPSDFVMLCSVGNESR
jgi:hypothetical protein